MNRIFGSWFLFRASILLSACMVCMTQVSDSEFRMHPYRMIPLPISGQETTAKYWQSRGQAQLISTLKRPERVGTAKNVILFMGDGMSIPTLTAARIHSGGEASDLVWDKFPIVGHSKTYCTDAMVADSACSATAFLGGVKCNTATLGVTAAVLNKDCMAQRNVSNHVFSILRKAQLAGKSTGIVTTTRITHASPAAGYAHVAERDWESDADVLMDNQNPMFCDDIAEQLVRGETGHQLNVILGGGRAYFRPTEVKDEENLPGKRKDGVDLIAEWIERKKTQKLKWGWAWDKDSLKKINPEKTKYLLGLFEPGHLKYNLDNDPKKKPTLPELTRLAIKLLSQNPKGYVLFVEGGRIDHAHHETRPQLAVDETLQFADAISYAIKKTSSKQTLIVVTSDHAHTMSIGGYPPRGIALQSDVDMLPLTTLTYANGPGYKRPLPDGTRYDVSNDDFKNPKYQYPSLAPLLSETHGGDDVAVFALGPWEHIFSGTYEQNYIEHAMCFASNLGDGLTAKKYSKYMEDSSERKKGWDEL